jgi:hypothetical protein
LSGLYFRSIVSCIYALFVGILTLCIGRELLCFAMNGSGNHNSRPNRFRSSRNGFRLLFHVVFENCGHEAAEKRGFRPW